MGVRWYRRDREAVVAALRRGERPDMATTMAAGPLDEVVARHEELGILAALEAVEVERARAGLPDALLLRTLATLPFVREAALSGAAGALFREPAILLHLGWAPSMLRAGANGRHRHPVERQPEARPCHPDTLRDALRRVGAAAWERAQRAGVGALYARGLVRGRVYALDGSGVGAALRLVCLVCVSGERPVIVAWRLLEGSASEKGKAAAVTQALVEQALAVGGEGRIELRLAAALSADGPLLAWLKYATGIDARVPLPADRRRSVHRQGLARAGLIPWTRHRSGRTIRGHQHRRTVEVAGAGGLTTWERVVEAAAASGPPEATLWGGLVREVAPQPQPVAEALGLVSTRAGRDGFAAYQAYRPRWHVEHANYRELKEGWGLEAPRWGRDPAAARGRTPLTCLAFTTAQVYRSRAGEQLARLGIRRLRRVQQPAPGAAPVVIYLAGCYAVLALEERLRLLGAPVRESVLPAIATAATAGPSP